MLKIVNNDILTQSFVNDYYEILDKRLKKIINQKGLPKTENRTAVKLSPNDIKLLKKFNNEKMIKTLMSAKAKYIRNFIELISKKYPTFNHKKGQRKSNINKVLFNIFVDNGYNNVNKFKFIDDIGLKSCPYCNRTFIYTLNNKRNLKPQIDHFYHKANYPYLAMSYYNLIPSCPTCNGFGAKEDKDSYEDGLKHPYEIESNDFKFSFDIESINIIDNKLDEDSVKIELKTKYQANSDYFGLEELYKEHRDVVVELYQKFYQENTKEHFRQLSNSLESIGIDKDEVYKLVTCSYQKDEDLHKRPLSKLIKDISKELELIK